MSIPNAAPHVGKAYSGPCRNMASFDKLPKALRVAIANADHNWSAGHMYQERSKPKRIRKPQVMTTRDCIDHVRRSDTIAHIQAVACGEMFDQHDFKPLYARKVRRGRRAYV